MYVIGNFEAEHDGLKILGRTITLEQMTVIDPDIFSKRPIGIWHTLIVNGMPTHKNLVGGVNMIIKNQQPNSTTSLDFRGLFFISPIITTQSADTFAKLINFLLDRINKQVAEDEIKDENGAIFILPPYNYLTKDFQMAFPQ